MEQLQAHLESGAFDPGPGGKIILQQYIEAAEPFITRVEVAGGRFLFAMRSNTEGGFELCPSDACQLPAEGTVCPAEAPSSKFSPSPLTSDDPLVQKYLKLTTGEGIEIAGIEFIEAADGTRYTYDINGTTNYSGVLAELTGIEGMKESRVGCGPRWRQRLNSSAPLRQRRSNAQFFLWHLRSTTQYARSLLYIVAGKTLSSRFYPWSMVRGSFDVLQFCYRSCGFSACGLFFLEAVLWRSPMVTRLFQMSRGEAETTRVLALNQGVYIWGRPSCSSALLSTTIRSR